MSEQPRKKLHIPQGTEGLHFEEAHRHRVIVEDLSRLYGSWGYAPATTPAMDFFDNYTGLFPDNQAERIYRLIDREGDLLMLRSDITLFLARQVSLKLSKEKLPLRVWYADTILRHESRENISRNEFFQIGAELFGEPEIRGDLEILLLLNKVLAYFKTPFYLHLNSINFFNALLEPLQADYQKKVKKTLLTRDREYLTKLLAESKIKKIDCLLDFLLFIGDIAEFSDLLLFYDKKNALPVKVKKTGQELLKIAEQVIDIDFDGCLRLDISEIGSQNYHTGIVFRVYMRGANDTVATGGRYDNLMSAFDFPCHSVGFSLLLRKIEPLCRDQKRFVLPEKISVAKNLDIGAAYKQAERLRGQGKVVTL